MLIESNWKLTWDPATAAIVLVNFGDLIEEEFAPEMSKPAEVVNLAGSSAPFIRDIGNRSFRLSVSVVLTAADDKTMRRAMMESLATVGALTKKVLKVQVNGITDRYWKFNSAIITEHAPRPIITAKGPRYAKKYGITAADFVQVGP